MARIPESTTDRRTKRSASPVLSQEVLVVDFRRTAVVTNADGLALGRTERASRLRLSVVELNGRPVLDVGAHQAGRNCYCAVSGADGALLGQVTAFFADALHIDGAHVAKVRGIVNLTVVALPSGAELARIRRQPLWPGWHNNFVTRFSSPRYRIEFVTADPTMRVLVIALVFVRHCTRLDD